MAAPSSSRMYFNDESDISRISPSWRPPVATPVDIKVRNSANEYAGMIA